LGLYQIWTIMLQIRTVGLAAILLLSAGCAHKTVDQDTGIQHGGYADGLAVGFVVNSGATAALKPYERRRYADKLASAILEYNPGLTGMLDSYGYVSARVGKGFSELINSYRLEGELSNRALRQIETAQLRRRYLMLATIAPVDEVFELPAEVQPRQGPSNYEIDDYENVRLHTVRLNLVRVEVYDTRGGQKIFEQEYSSDDQNSMLATEEGGVRYVGNSLLAALANGVSNRIKHGSDLKHPKAPAKDLTLDQLWRQVAQSLPGAIRY
jgi:hypothetical protein